MISFSAIPAIFPSTCYALVQIVRTSFQAPGRPSRGGSHRACRAPGPESAYGANRKLRSAAAPLSRPGRRSTSGLTSSKKSSAAERISADHIANCVFKQLCFYVEATMAGACCLYESRPLLVPMYLQCGVEMRPMLKPKFAAYFSGLHRSQVSKIPQRAASCAGSGARTGFCGEVSLRDSVHPHPASLQAHHKTIQHARSMRISCNENITRRPASAQARTLTCDTNAPRGREGGGEGAGDLCVEGGDTRATWLGMRVSPLQQCMPLPFSMSHEFKVIVS